MHCNLRSPEPRQLFPALITTSCQVWRRWNCPLPYYSVFPADTLLYAVTLRRWLYIWPWTFAAYRLWRDETLYQISTQSNNPRRSYCVVWPCDLEHVLSVALGSVIMFTKFGIRQLIRAWIIAFFDAGTLWQALTLTYWSCKFVVHQASRGQSLY